MNKLVRSYTLPLPWMNVNVMECGPESGIPIIFIHGYLATSLFHRRIIQKMPPRYRCIAYDLRCHGHSSAVPIDATQGLKNFSDDLHGVIEALNIKKTHIMGWCRGGNIAMQYAIDHSDKILSLILESPGSPYGLFGTEDELGTPTFPDYAGSGVTSIALYMKSSIEKGISDKNAYSHLLGCLRKTWYTRGKQMTEELEREYVSEFFLSKTGDDFLPGNYQTSINWPGWRPGNKGYFNACSAKYHNLSRIIHTYPKPPILWLRGDKDTYISDCSTSDPAVLGMLGKIKGYPGKELYRPQPMLRQIRRVLDLYSENGGSYQEIVIKDCGHAPQIEREEEFLIFLWRYLEYNPRWK
ncbi:unnamed protein product [Blepharisma stoltei]|uniref:AB hydrolase-1 domain-containing protein n=1 Tax=Blepharisma stoltei TaxID=1481888 RepID=A0AAU9IS82_9CILI|nr:unnamed protein product [Blepharisma stoltei]